MASRALMRMH